MTELFVHLARVSVTAGWLVLAVCAIRAFARRMPKRMLPLLWLLVGLRLLIPVSIESSFSVMPAPVGYSGPVTRTATPAAVDMPQLVDAAGGPAGALEDEAGPVSTDPAVHYVVPATADVIAPVSASVSAPAAPGEGIGLSGAWPGVIWCAGVAVMLTYAVAGSLCLRRRLATAVRWKDHIYQSEFVKTPFILGMLSPRVYLPYHMEEKQMASVIAHEQAHIRRRDHWLKPAAFAVLAVYWFNPLMWVAFVLLSRDIELACDERAIRDMSGNQRADYAEALLYGAVGWRDVAIGALSFGNRDLKRRIVAVLNYRKPTWWMRCLSAVIVVAFVLCFMTDPISEAEEKTPSVGSETANLIGTESSLPSEKALQALMTRLNWDLRKETEKAIVLSAGEEELLDDLHVLLKEIAITGGSGSMEKAAVEAAEIDPYKAMAIEALMRRMRKIAAFEGELNGDEDSEELKDAFVLITDCKNILPVIVLGMECIDVLPSGKVAAVYENLQQLLYVNRYKEMIQANSFRLMSAKGDAVSTMNPTTVFQSQRFETTQAFAPEHAHQWGSVRYQYSQTDFSLLMNAHWREALYSCTVEGCTAIRTFELGMTGEKAQIVRYRVDKASQQPVENDAMELLQQLLNEQTEKLRAAFPDDGGEDIADTDMRLKDDMERSDTRVLHYMQELFGSSYYTVVRQLNGEEIVAIRSFDDAKKKTLDALIVYLQTVAECSRAVEVLDDHSMWNKLWTLCYDAEQICVWATTGILLDEDLFTIHSNGAVSITAYNSQIHEIMQTKQQFVLSSMHYFFIR